MIKILVKSYDDENHNDDDNHNNDGKYNDDNNYNDDDGKIALHLLFGWSLDKDEKSLDQSKQFS